MSRNAAFRINAGDLEHLGVLATGTALVAVGVTKRKSAIGWMLTGLGAAMLMRGAQGYKRLYPIIGKSLPGKPVTLARRAIKVEQTIAINRTPEDLYRFWRNLENLPKVMSHLLSVQQGLDGTSHWVAKAPVGTIVEWDAQIINDIPNELIAWRSLEGSDVDNAGSVHFQPMAEGACRVCVVIRYTPPADVLGAGLARLFGADPADEVAQDLKRFKRMMESESLV